MKDTILAYTAGLIDGEGYIGLHPRQNSRVTFTPTIKVVSTDAYMVPFLHQNFGGSLSKRRVPKKPEWRSSIEWQLRGKEVRNFLKAIRPYLTTKAAQADNLIAFIDECGSFVGRRKFDHQLGISTYDEDFVNRRIWYFNEAKRLRHIESWAAAETE